jgi:hypothetical protein
LYQFAYQYTNVKVSGIAPREHTHGKQSFVLDVGGQGGTREVDMYRATDVKGGQYQTNLFSI